MSVKKTLSTLSHDNEVPLIEDELNRKTCEAIQWLLDAKHNGMGDNTYKFGLKVINITTSGLVDEEITKGIWSELNAKE